MNTITQIRQGDVLLIRRAAPDPATLTRREDLTGLRVPGERTGHAHVLPAEVYDTDRGERLLLTHGDPITHEEHGAVAVPPGWWEPVLQREFTPSSRPTPRARFD